MSDNHDLLNDNDMCSFSGHGAEDMCFNCGDHTCGDGVLAIAQSTSLSGFVCFPRVCERIVLWRLAKEKD